MAQAFDKGLHAVVPPGGHGWALNLCHQHGTHIVVAQKGYLFVGER